ncbi:MAG TPA: GldG family protein, partial [Gemmatimonadaceae bacterium]|nr:GldG family protein [Gemmatimonadaceae bacterium]
GAALLAAGLAGVGVWASSLTRSQITAFILAVAVTFVLILVGLDPLIVGLPATLGVVAARLGVLSHFGNIGRGVIDLRDAIYFVSLAAIFLALAHLTLVSRSLARGGERRRQLRLATGLLVAILVVVNLLGGYIGGRLDLTPGGQYTLSKGSRDIVRSLDDLVTIKVFASDELPTQIGLLKRDVDDLVADLRSASNGKLRVVRRNPSTDSTARHDAESLGIGPIQFNVIGSSELQVKNGYLGIAVQYGDKHESIPFVDRTSDLEYRVASAIRSVTRTTKPVIGVITGHGDDAPPLQGLRGELAQAYDVRDIPVTDPIQPDSTVRVMLLAGEPDSVPAPMAARLDAWLHRGGGALVLDGGAALSRQLPMASPLGARWNDLLKPFGVSVRSDLVYDLAANEVIPANSNAGPFQVLTRYPFFVRGQSTGASPVNRGVRGVTLPWPSSIDTSHATRGSVTPLVVTTSKAGAETGPASIDPGRDFSDKDLSARVLGVQVVGADTTVRGRLVVVGNSEFVSDRFVRQAPENLAFALNAIDWLAQDQALIAIRSVDRKPPTLRFTSAALREGVKYVNLVGVPLLLALYGFARTSRRRARAREPYVRAAHGAPATATPTEAA